MSSTDVYNALNASIADGSIDLWTAANGSPALAPLIPVLELFGLTAKWDLTSVQLSQGIATVLLTGSGSFSASGATDPVNAYPVSASLTYSDSNDSFQLNLQVTGSKVWTFSNFFLNLPKTMRADVDVDSSGGIRWFDSFLNGVVIKSALFAARTDDTALTLTGFLPEFEDPNIADRLGLLSPWPLRLSGSVTMPTEARNFPLMELTAMGSPANMFTASNEGGVDGPAPISLNGLGIKLIIDVLDPLLWGEDAFSTLRLFGSFDLGGGLAGIISNLTLSNGKTWSFSVQFDPEHASFTEGLISLGRIFGVDLPIPMNFPLLSAFQFSAVDIDFFNSADSDKNPSLSLSGLAVTVVSTETWKPPVPFVTFENVGTRWVWGWTIVNDPVTGSPKNINLVTGSVFASVIFGPDGNGTSASGPGGTPPLPPGPTLPALAQRGGEPALVAAEIADGSDTVTIDISLSLPSLYVNGQMREGDYIGIGAAFNKYFGGVCPGVPDNMNVTQLGFFADPIGQVYSGNATILFGTPDDPQPDQAWTIFSIGTVGISLQSLEMWIEAQGGRIGGGITGVFYLEGAGSESYQDPQITVSAEYPVQNTDAAAGWLFAGSLYPGTSIDLTDMVARFIVGDPTYKVPSYVPILAVDALASTFATASGAYTFSGTMSVRWNPTIFGTDVLISASASTSIARAGGDAAVIGKIWGTFSVNKISIMAGLDIGVAEPTYLFKVQFDQLWAEGVTSWRTGADKTRHQVVAIQLGGVTLGAILEYLVNLAAPTLGFSLTPPWDILNRIDLSRFVLTIDPTDNVVEFIFNAAVDLGVMRIDTVGARYTKGTGQGKVELILTGNFLGQQYTDDKPLSWDVVNDSPPAVAGQGSSIVDLRFIGFGQRVTFSGATPDTVAESVARLSAAMQTPTPGENPLSNPGIVYSDQSQWLIGLDVSLMEMIDLAIIFNDPRLYGLSVALKGEKAGSLAGLRFEILYKKITDDIGMYRIELQVPDAFRTIQLGAVSLTLGIIVVEIYTNGNFMIDLGFPYNRVYSRSFTIQAGIFIGRGGFYFGVLNGDTSTRVPRITNGNFAPVIELGVGLAAGVGREINAGVLSGGAYIEIEVLFQGVLAWFNPTSNGAASAKFYWARGVIAIHGKVYGSVNFFIIQVSLTLEVWAQASVTFESCKPILLDLAVGVRAEASIKILFIRIHFHFSVTLDLSFTVGSASPTPWILASGAQTISSGTDYTAVTAQDHRLRKGLLKETHRHVELMRRFSATPALVGESSDAYILSWNPANLVFDSKQLAQLTMLPLFTVKQVPVDWSGATPSNPVPQYRAAFLLYADTGMDAAAKTVGDTIVRSAALSAASSNDDDTSALAAELLTKGLLLYALYTLPAGPSAITDPITAGQLALIAEQLLLPATRELGFSYDQLKIFFTTNLHFQVSGVPTGGVPTEKAAMVFPIPPCFSWTSPQWGARDFSQFNMVGNIYEQQIAQILGQYFPVENENGGATETDESFSQFMFRDFCEMLVKAAVDEAQKQLQDVTVTFDKNVTPPIITLADAAKSYATATVPCIKQAGDTVASVAARVGATTAEIAFLNDVPGEPISTTIDNTVVGATLQIKIGIAPEVLALDNPSAGFVAQALTLGTLTKQADQTYDTLAKIAQLFNVANLSILTFQPESGYTTAQDPNLLSVGSAFSLTAPRTFVPPAAGFDLNRAAALFFVRYDNPDLTPAGAPDLPAWYAQAISLMNIEVLATASAAGTIPQSVEIEPGTTLQIPVKYNDQTPNLLAYTTVAGDTLYRIGAMLTLAQDNSPYFSPPLWSGFKAAVTSSGSNFIIPAWVIDTAAGNPGIVIESGENIETLARRLVIDATFDSVSPVGGSWIWTYDWNAISIWIGDAAILSTQGVVTVPNATTDAEVSYSFSTLAEVYGLSIPDAAARLKDVAGLYADASTLTVKQTPVQTIANIVDGVLGSASFAGVVNQASRMMMAGLNLPNPITDKDGNIVADPANPQPLYDLTGQQDDVLLASDPAQIALALTVSSSEDWITLGSSVVVAEGDTLSQLSSRHTQLLTSNPGLAHRAALRPGMILATGANDTGVLTFSFTNADVSADLATGLSIALSPATPPAPSSMTLKGFSPRTYGFEHRIVLQTPIALKIPVAGDAPVGGSPSLWTFPASLLDRAVNGASTTYEIYSNLQGASQQSAAALVSSATFGTLIPFRIRKIDDGTERFALLGVDTDQRDLLLELKDWLASDADAAQTQAVLAIPPAPNASNAQGIVVLDPALGANYLIKTNLSTESQPPPQALLADALGAEDGAIVYFADFQAALADFLLLLWEGSVVGGTGYYFGSGTTLPGSAFDDRGTATLNMLIIPGSQQALPSATGRALLKFNTCLLVAPGLDASINTLYAESGDDSDLSPLCLVPAGNAGFTLAVDRRLTAVPPISDDQRNLEERYNLLTFSSAAQADSPYKIDEAWTPALPVPDDGSGLALWQKQRLLRKQGKTLNALADVESPYWRYDQVIPFYNFTIAPAPARTTGLPDPASDPYRGFADLSAYPSPQLSYRFSDLLGNRSAAASAGQGRLTLAVGYTDPLIGLSDWPSAAASFQVLGSNGAALLSVNLSLKAAALLPTPSQRGDVNLDATTRQKEKYAQVYYQLIQDGVQASLATTLRWNPDPLNGLNAGQAIDIAPLWRFAAGAYALSASTELLAPTLPAATLKISDLPAAYGIRYAELAEANKDRLVSVLFNIGATALQLPAYLPYIALRSLDDLYRTRPTGWPSPGNGAALFSLPDNQGLLLKTGTSLVLPAAKVRNIATGTAVPTPSLASLAEGNQTTAEIIATNNLTTSSLLEPGFIFSVEWEEADETVITVAVTVVGGTLDSFDAVQKAFSQQGINLSAAQIAAENAMQTGMFAPEKTLLSKLYVVQEGDTPATNKSACSAGELGAVNGATPSVFDDGSLVSFGSLSIDQNSTLDELATRYACSGETFFSANSSFLVGTDLAIPGSISWPADAVLRAQLRVPYTIRSGDIFSAIVSNFAAYDGLGGAATVEQAVQQNRQLAGTLAPDVSIVVTVQGTPVTIVTGPDDSFDAALAAVKLQASAATLDDLAAAIADQAGVLAAGALLLMAPALLAKTASPNDAASPTKIAATYGIDAAAFALANTATVALLAAGVGLTCRDTTTTSYTVTTKANDTFNSVILAFALQGITVDAGKIALQNPDALLYDANGLALLPPATVTPKVTLGAGGPYMAPVFALSTTLTLTRPNALINPEFKTATEDGIVERADTPIAPLSQQSAGAETDLGLTYQQFIANLYLALSDLRAGTAKVADAASDLWCVDFSTSTSTSGIYKVALLPGTEWQKKFYPRFFALAPLYDHLVTRSDVTIQTLDDQGNLAGGSAMSFQAIDTEPLAQRFLADFDRFLSAYYAPALYDYDGGALQTTLNNAIASKQLLIPEIADGLEFVLVVDEDPNLASGTSSARKSFQQQLGVSMLKAYDTSVAIQYDLTVDSPWTRGATSNPASLYGDASLSAANFAASIVAAKTPLDQAQGAVTFFATVADPSHVRALRGELDYAYAYTEFDISSEGVPQGYTSSEWLSFLPLQDAAAKPASLSGTNPAGPIAAPIPLRTFPALPTIKSQTANPSALHPQSLAALSLWSFGLSYTHQHAAQDTVYINAEFNLRPNILLREAAADPRDLFTELAQYAAVADKLWNMLDGLLTDAPPDAKVVNAAQTFAALAASIAQYWPVRIAADKGNVADDDQYIADEVYEFTARVEYSDLDTVLSYALTETTTAGPAGQWPLVYGYDAAGLEVLLTAGAAIDGKVTYTVPDGAIVPATDSPSFRLVWEDINVSAYQNARAKIWVERNQYLLEDSDPALSLMIPTNPDFIFKTAEITASSIATPLLQWTDRQQITVSPGADDTMADALIAALDTLFPVAGRLAGSTATYAVYYGYELAGDSTLFNNSLVGKTPVTLYPNQALEDGVADSIDAALKVWYAKNRPAMNGGEWAFGLILYSALESAQRPIFSAELFYRIPS